MKKPISILLLASAAIHAAVLGLVDFDSTIDAPIGTRMRISIQAPSLPSAPALHETKKNIRPQEYTTTKSLSVEASKPTQLNALKETTDKKIIKEVKETPKEQQNRLIENETNDIIDTKTIITASVETIAPPNPTPVKASLPASTSSLLYADLERAFSLHFYYPRLAIKRGWQGDVQLSLRVDADGKLSHVRILKGSGFSLLDKAAMNSLDKVEILPAAIALLDGNSLELILPVEYRLL